jgi:hypothetical protein
MFPISAAIWRTEKEGRSFYSVTFQLSYRDEKGGWQNSDSFGLGDREGRRSGPQRDLQTPWH